MTIHSAKGLEFPHVFIVGLEENLFPSQLSIGSRVDLEEERRLFYVALTRAEKQATLSYATTRYRYGNITYCEPSRFIDEIDEKYLDYPEEPLIPQFKNNANGQYQFEQLVRRETPAHVVVRFCWMSPKEMYQFETAYLKWLYENALEKPNERELTEHVNNLVTIMKQCNFSIREIGDPCLHTGTPVKEIDMDDVKYK